MKIKLWIVLSVSIVIGAKAFAIDLGFRYQNGKCVNSAGQVGLNPSFFGPCSDLRGVTLHNLNLEGIDFSGSQFVSSDLQKISFKATNLTGVNFEGANLFGINFDEAQVHGVNFQQAILKNVTFSEARIQESSFANVDLRGNDLNYARFESCDLTRANFGQAQLGESEFLNSNLTETNFEKANLRKANFAGSRMLRANLSNSILDAAQLSSVQGDEVNLMNASLKNADLSHSTLIRAQLNRTNLTEANLSQTDFSQAGMKGTDLTGANFQGAIFKDATYSTRTKLPFSEETARNLGMLLIKVKAVLVLWDQLNDYVKNFASGLENISDGQIETTLSASSETQFAGQYSLVDYDAIIHLNGKDGASNDVDLPEAGQKALVAYVQNGGNFIYGEWQAYAVAANRYRFMRDLVLFARTSDRTAAMMITFSAEGMKHSLFYGLTNPVRIDGATYNLGSVVRFEQNPVTVLANNTDTNPAVGIRKFGNGQIVGFSFTCTYRDAMCLNQENVRRLYSNAVLSQ